METPGFTCPSCGDTTPFETDCPRCGVAMVDAEGRPSPPPATSTPGWLIAACILVGAAVSFTARLEWGLTRRPASVAFVGATALSLFVVETLRRRLLRRRAARLLAATPAPVALDGAGEVARVVGTVRHTSLARAPYDRLGEGRPSWGPRRFEVVRDDGVRVRVDEPFLDLAGDGAPPTEGDRIEVVGRVRRRATADGDGDGAGYRDAGEELLVEGGDGVRVSVRRLRAAAGGAASRGIRESLLE